jgi:hypothetical protein
MSWNSNLLVIAHRTVDSDHLMQLLCARAAAGPIRVTLLVPAHGDRVSTARRADRAAQYLESKDITVEAMVGHPDPIVALDEVWRPYRYDEVIVATLPDRRSRRLMLALPHRVERFTGVEVTHVAAPVWWQYDEPVQAAA